MNHPAAHHPPADFLAALHSLRTAHVRGEVCLEEVRAPHKVAPYALALTGEIMQESPARMLPAPGRRVPGHEASGRFVLLHDPIGQPSWNGTFRVVVMARAELDPDVAADPLVPRVVWDWLDEALGESGAGYRSRAGTVTRVLSESFDARGESSEQTEVEIRASWTPTTLDACDHLTAWSHLLCSFAGLEPEPAARAVLHRVPDVMT